MHKDSTEDNSDIVINIQEPYVLNVKFYLLLIFKIMLVSFLNFCLLLICLFLISFCITHLF